MDQKSKKKLALLKKKKKLALLKQKKKGKKKQETEVEARFLRVKYDPVFQKVDRKETRIKIDSRFKEVLTNNKRFSSISSTKVDKYGRKVQKEKIDKETKELFFDPNSTLDQEKKNNDDPLPFHWSAESSSEEDFEGDLHDLLGEKVEEYDFMEGEEKIEMRNISSKRLAMMNYDWENITTGDIFITLSSFLPAGGEVKSVKKYLSDFGEEMLKKELEQGPLAAWDAEIEEKTGKNEEVDKLNEKLNDKSVRLYELNRLKYYYAVIEFDGEKSADFVYTNVNNMEIMNTGISIDLRVIPEDLEIPRPPVEEVKEKPSRASNFNFFVKAKQHTSVEITWEKPERGNKNSHLFEVDDEVLDNRVDLTEIINSDDLAGESEEEEEEKDVEEIRKRLLGNGKNVYSDFDKAGRRDRQQVDVKFLAAFEDEESSSDETDKEKIVFSRNFKADRKGSEDQDEKEVKKDEFFEENEEEAEPAEEKKKSKKMTKREKFKKNLKEKRRLRAKDERDRRQNVRNKRNRLNDEANLVLLTKRDQSEGGFQPEFDSRFDRIWKDRNMNVDPTVPDYDAEKAKVIFEERKKRKRKKLKV